MSITITTTRPVATVGEGLEMKYILTLIAALVSLPVLAMDLGQVEATINSCRNGVVCSCPRARINLVDLIKSCGNGPDIKLDQDSNFSNRREFEAWGKCGKEVFAANDEIRRYNAIFEHCQRPYSKSEDVRRPLANQPHISTGTPDSDKTLAEQQTEAKQRDPDDVDRLQAEAERRALAAAQQPRPTQQMPTANRKPPSQVAREYISQKHGRMAECVGGSVFKGRDVLCLSEYFFPGYPECDQDLVNGHAAYVCPGDEPEHIRQYGYIKQRYTSGQPW